MTKQEKLKFHELQVLWWIASAQTGHAKTRKIFKSVNSLGDTEMTDQEKVNDAMNTAQNHIRLFHEISEGPDF